MFTIVLGIRYNREVKLSLLYTDAINPHQKQEILTSVTYINATVINHLEFASQVPFNKFKAQVRLRFSDGTYGPYNDVPGEFGKTIIIFTV